ncbi:MAG: multicopper oxidase domain-containing protein [Ilumatobacteraceae bacterium]
MTITEDRPATGDAPPPPERSKPSGLSAGVFLAMTGLLIVLVLGVLAIGVVALIQDDDGGGGGAAASTGSTVDVQLTEFAIEGELAVPEGNVTLNVVNAGAIEHNLAVIETGDQTRNLTSRGVDVLDLGVLEPGTYELVCTISGHRESGMENELVVYAEGEEPEGAAFSEENMTPEEMDQMMVDSVLAYLDPELSDTEGKGNPVLEPEILADGTKKFVLEAAVTPWEVSPGEFVDAWTYNGVVPGPQIIVDIGDNVQVELTNNTPLGTDIHWHGIDTPNDQDGVSPFTQEPIGVGETFTYEFVADAPSIGMYHAHLHSQTSVINGMFAAFIIGENPLPRGQTISGVTIPEDVDPVFEEPMVLNDAGVIGLTLNGKSFPATEKIVMNEGDWGVIHYYNEGLTAHPMHLHQFGQLVYAKDGFPLEQPYWADTINVAPGERYSVLFQATDPGVWVYHCHILTHVERVEGMFGMVTAVVVTEEEA